MVLVRAGEERDIPAVAALAQRMALPHRFATQHAWLEAHPELTVCASNAVKIVEAAPTQNVLFVPDRNLAAYVAANTKKNVIAWDGDCYVHHQIRPDVGRSSSPIKLRSVLLPEPEGPISAANSPACRLSDSPCSTSASLGRPTL